MQDLTETITGKLEQNGIPKEELKTNQPRTNTQPVIVKFKTHSFKGKTYNKQKNPNKNLKLVPSLTRIVRSC